MIISLISDEAQDSLLNAELWLGGNLGVMTPEKEGLVRAELTGLGLIGPRGCLTSKGLFTAARIYKEYWNEYN